jgi:prolyl 4-hydroxylase
MNVKKIAEGIFTIDGFLSAAACDSFIRKSEAIGYEAASVQTERGARVIKTIRNNNRVLYNDTELARTLWEQAKDVIPPKVGDSNAIGLNELFRFYKYEPGQQFKRHIDQSYIRNEREASYYTFMIYLNDGFEGGETTFGNISIRSEMGKALIFLHTLEHEGSEVTTGVKYVLRTDIMYRLSN